MHVILPHSHPAPADSSDTELQNIIFQDVRPLVEQLDRDHEWPGPVCIDHVNITRMLCYVLYVMYERPAPEPFDVIRKRTRRDTGLTTRVVQTEWLSARYKDARLEASEGEFWNMNRIVCLHMRTCVDCCFPC